MSLIKSVSGIRGTIGGKPGDNLTPPDIVAFVAAYGTWLMGQSDHPVVIIGRDGRISGEFVKNLVMTTLRAIGIDVVDLDYSTTPSVEMYVISSGANGGIIITASHNPEDWNALKFLNHEGEFISQEAGEEIKRMAEAGSVETIYASLDKFGKMSRAEDAIELHINAILAHPLVDADKIKKAGFKAVIDCINSTGNISIPPLLDRLGVQYVLLNDGNYGRFDHNPEPQEQHLQELINAVTTGKANIGISIDPDVDRLALVCENGEFFGEEYTLVCAADYVLQHKPGPLVTNLSSSRALGDLAQSRGVECFYAPVGEVHVVKEMKLRNAVLGGEGNGGIIDPQLHYGRDALIGLALVLMQMASSGKSLSALKKTYPEYVMIKDKITFNPMQSAKGLMDNVAEHFKEHLLDHRDGLKIDLNHSWVQLRKSNTEPILRIYAEARTLAEAQALIDEVKGLL